MKRAAAPGCVCPARRSPGMGHRVDCPVAVDAMKRLSTGAARPAGSADGLGRSSRRHRARPTERRGITFRSGVEADLFELLAQRLAAPPGGALIRQVRFDLWKSWQPGMGKPLCFTPDFLVVRPRAVRAIEPVVLEDDVRGVTTGDWTERLVDVFDVEVHEAKTDEGLESRDYRPRLAAFRAEHPTWPVTVWRRLPHARTGLIEQRLADLAPATPGATA